MQYRGLIAAVFQEFDAIALVKSVPLFPAVDRGVDGRMPHEGRWLIESTTTTRRLLSWEPWAEPLVPVGAELLLGNDEMIRETWAGAPGLLEQGYKFGVQCLGMRSGLALRNNARTLYAQKCRHAFIVTNPVWNLCASYGWICCRGISVGER